MTVPVKLAYSETGGGLPVVLLHGYPLNGTIWREQQKGLSPHFRVIAPDLRGHGGTVALEGIYDMDTQAGDVFNLLDSLEIDKFVLMGHSMGGYVSLAAWKMHSERVLALGLICSHAGADTEEGRQGRLNTAERVASAGARGAQIVAETMLPRLFAAGIPTDQEVREEISQIILATNPTGIIGALKGMAARPDSNPVLPEIGCPVLLLCGDKDAIIPTARAEAMSAVIPNSTFVVVEDAGHLPMVEQPTATTEAMRQFLAKLEE